MRHGLAGELPDTPRFACAAHTTYHDRGAHEGAHVCPFAFWRDTVLRAGSRISRRTLTLQRAKQILKFRARETENLLGAHSHERVCPRDGIAQ